MRLRRVVGAALALATLCACTTGSPKPTAAHGTSAAGSPSASATAGGTDEPEGVLAADDALRVIEQYDRATGDAARRRDARATKTFQSGAMLAVTLAGYVYSKAVHKRSLPRTTMSLHSLLIPESAADGAWFLESSYRASSATDIVSLFERAPNGHWRKTMEVPGTLSEPPAGQHTMALPDAAGQARDRATLAALVRYLNTGKSTSALVGKDDLTDVRAWLKLIKRPTSFDRTSAKCGQLSSSRLAALATGDGGTQFVATIDCVVATVANPGQAFRISGIWKHLASRSRHLVALVDHEYIQVAVLVGSTGDIHVNGVDWSTVSVGVR